jgi:hypothetical protein
MLQNLLESFNDPIPLLIRQIGHSVQNIPDPLLPVGLLAMKIRFYTDSQPPPLYEYL